MWDIVSYRTGSRFLLFNVYIERVVLTEEDLGAYKKFLKKKNIIVYIRHVAGYIPNDSIPCRVI